MAANGSYHMAWGPGAIVPGTNPTGSHNPGNFGSNEGIVTGCGGPLSSCQTAAGNPGYQYNLKGGRLSRRRNRHRSHRRNRRYRGGYGYGFLEPQQVVGNYTMGIERNSNIGINDPSMLGTTKQYNPTDYPLKSIPTLKGGRHRRRHYGGAVNYFYGYAPENEGSQTVFMGSGYPEITKGSQCGGRRRTRKHHRRTRSDLFRKLRGGKRYSRSRSRSRSQRGGYHQYLGNQPFSLKYETGGELSPSLSALANPAPFKPINSCTDPNGPPK